MDVRQTDELFPGYARDCIKVRSKDGGFVPLELNRAQRHLWQRELVSPKRYHLRPKSRQMGITTTYLARHLFRFQVIPAYSVGVVALKTDDAELISRNLREMYDAQPDAWLAAAPKLVKQDDSLLENSTGGRITLITQGGRNPGRSRMFHELHYTEFGKWDNPGETLAALDPTLAPMGTCTIESTPGGYNTYFDLCTEALTDPASPWDITFLPWFWADEYVEPAPRNFQPTGEEQLLITQHGLTPEQIAFRRLKHRTLKGLAFQEFAEDLATCFVASGDSVFDFDQIQRIRTGSRLPLPEESSDDGILSIWQPPFAGVPYIIGADCAEGVPNGDYSAAVVLRAKSGQHVATLMDAPPVPSSRERRMSTTQYASRLVALARHYNMAHINVELNGPGYGVINHILEVEKYPHVVRHEGHYGHRTNPVTKSALKTRFVDALDTDDFASYDARLAQQMSGFVVLERKANGYEAIGARKGSHDDLVMATMLANESRDTAIAHFQSGGVLTQVMRWG